MITDQSRSDRSRGERGQTLQDYALGIGVFLLTLFFVINVVVPSMLAPFDSEAGGDVEAQAERVANTFVENASEPGRINTLNISRVHDVAGEDQTFLQERYYLPDTSQVNISIRTLDGSAMAVSVAGNDLHAGSDRPGTGSVTRTRIVTLSDGACDPACRVVVSVW